MTYKLLADATVIIHLLWIVFLFVGAVWGRKYRAVKTVHLVALAFALISTALDWICPLTHVEVWLRTRHDPGLSYSGSFIAHYAEKVVYLDASRSAVFAATVVLVGVNVWLYGKGGKRTSLR